MALTKEPPLEGLPEKVFEVIMTGLLLVAGVVIFVLGIMLVIRGSFGLRIFGGIVLIAAVVLFVLGFIWGRRALIGLIKFLELRETA